jgi:hypothetical protein
MLAYVSRAKDARHLACACERVCAWVLNAYAQVLNAYTRVLNAYAQVLNTYAWVLNVYARVLNTYVRVLRVGALMGVHESLESYAWCQGQGHRGRTQGC